METNADAESPNKAEFSLEWEAKRNECERKALFHFVVIIF